MKLLDHVYNHTDVSLKIQKIIANPPFGLSVIYDSGCTLKIYSEMEMVFQHGRPYWRTVYYDAVISPDGSIKRKQVNSIGDYRPVE